MTKTIRWVGWIRNLQLETPWNWVEDPDIRESSELDCIIALNQAYPNEGVSKCAIPIGEYPNQKGSL